VIFDWGNDGIENSGDAGEGDGLLIPWDVGENDGIYDIGDGLYGFGGEPFTDLDNDGIWDPPNPYKPSPISYIPSFSPTSQGINRPSPSPASPEFSIPSFPQSNITSPTSHTPCQTQIIEHSSKHRWNNIQQSLNKHRMFIQL
jgi:hypothetical protein